MTRLKICGLTNADDAWAAVEAGAHAVGFVLEPSSPRAIAQAQAEQIAEQLPAYVTTVAVFGPMPNDFSSRVFDAVQATQGLNQPHRRAIRAIRLGGGLALDQALEAAEGWPTVLLDAYSSQGYGGTGETVDWGLAREFRLQTRARVILAGGLTPDNVEEVIRVVQPYAVDVSSGIEQSVGRKNHESLQSFAEAVRKSMG